MGWLGKTIFFAIVATLLAMCASNEPPAPVAQQPAYIAPAAPDLKVEYATPDATAAAGTPSDSAPHVASAWQYDKDTDQMTGKTITYAGIDDENSLHFKFPYSGPNFPSLLLRKHPQFGTNVILRVQKGQFLCHVRTCSVKVKFDDRPPVSFSADQPADHSTTELFLSPAAKFIAAAKTSKLISIQATFYRNGNPVMTFKSEGLDWK